MNNRSNPKLYIVAAISVGTVFGCRHIGPQSIVADRLAYNAAVLSSWEQETLLNIVRVRYDDVANFVDVGPVSQTHSLTGTTGVSFGSSIFPWDKIMNTLAPGFTGSRSTTDSPIITYTPLTGAQFTRNVNSPLKPTAICKLIESGFQVGPLLNLTLYSINDIGNANPDVTLNRPSKRNPDFANLTNAIECAHGHPGDLNFYTRAGADGENDKAFMIIADDDAAGRDEGCPDHPVTYVRRVLHLRAAAKQFEIISGSHPSNDTEIAVRTRSVISTMRWLSNFVHVPDEHARIAPKQKLLDWQDQSPLDVECTPRKPHGVFTAIQYKGYWFYINEGDSKSKYSLICLRTLLALADTAAPPSPPVLTIPTR